MDFRSYVMYTPAPAQVPAVRSLIVALGCEVLALRFRLLDSRRVETVVLVRPDLSCARHRFDPYKLCFTF